MQGELGRFAHGSNKEANTDHGHQHPVGAGKGDGAQLGGFGKGLGVVQGAGIGHDQADA